MKNKSLIYILVILILVVILGVFLKVALFDEDNSSSSSTSNTTNNYNLGSGDSSSSSTVSVDSSTAETVVAKDKRGDKTYSSYDATIDLDTLKLTGTGVSVSNNKIEISKAGTYYFTGTLKDGYIEINAGDDDNVILVFDNASITCSTTACINGINAKNIYINLVDGTTNTFTDSGNYTIFTEDDEPNGCIFSKTDLKICGTGTLVVNANYEDGIVSKDDLIITDATVIVTSSDDAIRGKDCVDLQDANITINAKNDAIKATNEDDNTKGYVLINGGNYEITAGDDGIHSETYLIINSGNINITKSHEGLEGAWVEINGGSVKVVADDDGINATTGNVNAQFGQGSSNAVMIINGGDVYVKAEGDGLDSNGSITLNGGNVVVVGTSSSGNGALDFDASFNVTGGSLVVYGGTGMWQNPSTTSTQSSVCFSASGKSGDKVEVKDSAGNTVESFTTEKAYNAILISNSKLTSGETYTLYVNGSEVSSQELTSVVTSEVSGEGFGGPGMGGGQMNGGQMNRGGMR